MEDQPSAAVGDLWSGWRSPSRDLVIPILLCGMTLGIEAALSLLAIHNYEEYDRAFHGWPVFTDDNDPDPTVSKHEIFFQRAQYATLGVLLLTVFFLILSIVTRHPAAVISVFLSFAILLVTCRVTLVAYG